MSQLTDVMIASGGAALRYGEMLLKDLKASQFARLPVVGGTAIQTNHPAWAYGHLSLYPGRILGMLGMSPSGPANPPKFEELFKNGTQCVDDPEGRIYPPMDQITGHFIAAMKAAIATLPKVDDAAFAKPNPVEGRF